MPLLLVDELAIHSAVHAPSWRLTKNGTDALLAFGNLHDP